jgi:hypothetical protein
MAQSSLVVRPALLSDRDAVWPLARDYDDSAVFYKKTLAT